MNCNAMQWPWVRTFQTTPTSQRVLSLTRKYYAMQWGKVRLFQADLQFAASFIPSPGTKECNVVQWSKLNPFQDGVHYQRALATQAQWNTMWSNEIRGVHSKTPCNPQSVLILHDVQFAMTYNVIKWGKVRPSQDDVQLTKSFNPQAQWTTIAPQNDRRPIGRCEPL